MKKTILMMLALAGFLVQSGAADGGGGFADFRKQQQARLLAAIDSTLAAKAEDAITDNFAAVRKVNIDFQSTIGGRNGNIGLNLIGALDESENHAYGWQLRAYSGKDINGGGNFGFFFRRKSDEAFVGANAFADYEKHKEGEFVRYSVGGEFEHSIFALAANYYRPITDNREVDDTTAAFSRNGFDAKLLIAPPRLHGLKAAADYYRFDGEGDTKADEGFRYGLQWNPNSALRLNLFYDNGGERFGGDMAYVWTIGETQARQNNNSETFAPDMFAAVSREYSQRIATVATDSFLLTPTLTVTTAVTVAAITTKTTTEAEMVVTTRMASVQITAGYSFSGGAAYVAVTSAAYFLLTLPPAPVSRPIALMVMRNLRAESNNANAVVVFSSDEDILPLGRIVIYPDTALNYAITVVQGTEQQFIIVTTTLTTRTSMTAAAISTTTRITTFMTTRITAGTNSAMAEPSFRHTPESPFAFQSSFRRTPESPFAFRQIPAYAGMTAMGGNDEGRDSGLRRNDERSGIPPNLPQTGAAIFDLSATAPAFPPPNFPHKRAAFGVSLNAPRIFFPTG